jgi:cation transport regulator ChaC
MPILLHEDKNIYLYDKNKIMMWCIMKYFAYGSNMDAEQMKGRGISFSQRMHAVLRGYSLRFNKVTYKNPHQGYANIVRKSGDVVEGILYEVSKSDLSNLDKYEGYPDHYDQKIVIVQTDSGEKVEAVAYIAHPDKVREGLKPTKKYLSHLLAARDILSKPYIQKLELTET